MVRKGTHKPIVLTTILTTRGTTASDAWRHSEDNDGQFPALCDTPREPAKAIHWSSKPMLLTTMLTTGHDFVNRRLGVRLSLPSPRKTTNEATSRKQPVKSRLLLVALLRQPMRTGGFLAALERLQHHQPKDDSQTSATSDHTEPRTECRLTGHELFQLGLTCYLDSPSEPCCHTDLAKLASGEG